FNLVTVPLVLPLCVYILFVGARRWRSRAAVSHTDFFTYNMVLIQVFGILGSCLLTGNQAFGDPMIAMIGISMFLLNSSSVLIFQIVTCLERYLAVVHPVTYLNMKSRTWALIRNLSCALVWLTCVVQAVLLGKSTDFEGYYFFSLLHLSLSLFAVMFCNLRVIFVLTRPGPGDGARAGQSNQKTLILIAAITGALLVKFAGDLLSPLSFLMLEEDVNLITSSCLLNFSVMWFSLPSTL
ncbi:hypothetical protein NL108_016041, partial [Boleophthalmus pectinirostris]